MLKKICLISLLLPILFMSKADPTEDLTDELANRILERLEKMPYILDYCDCCDNSTGFIIEVLEAKIVPCSYHANRVSIKVVGDPIAEVLLKGDNAPQVIDLYPEGEFNEVISTNYTWGFNQGVAMPLGYLEYSSLSQSCEGFHKIPFKEHHEGDYYKKFYNKCISPFLTKEITITANKLNVRKGKSTNSKVLTMVKKGEKFKVIKRSQKPVKLKTYHDFWYYIELPNGTKGWIFGHFTDAKIIAGNHLLISGEKVNVRAIPDIDGQIITQVNQSDNRPYLVLEETEEHYFMDNDDQDNWYKIKVGNKEGWVWGKLTSLAFWLPD